MDFEFLPGGELRCRDCDSEITLEQYRRKWPRCDDCEARHWLERLRQQLTAWGEAGARRRDPAVG
jgi:NAD-dependent SIR2 family protein deacetylase